MQATCLFHLNYTKLFLECQTNVRFILTKEQAFDIIVLKELVFCGVMFMSRQYRLANRKRFILFLLSCFMVLYFSFNIVNAGAALREQPQNDSVKVQNGDTLWEIASEYCSGDVRHFIFEVKQLNHMSQDTIHEGQLLLIP